MRQVETFLEDFHWESRSGGYRRAKTDQGDLVSSFIICHKTFDNSKYHYSVGARRSNRNSSRLICHLKRTGTFMNYIQHLGLEHAKSKMTLGDWTRAKFQGVNMILFD